MRRELTLLAERIERRPNTFVLAILLAAGALLLVNVSGAPVELAGPDGETYERLGHRAAQAPWLFSCGNFSHAYWSPGWVATIGAIYKVAGREPFAVRAFLVLVALAAAWITSRVALRLSGAVAAVLAPALFLLSTLVFGYTTYFQYEIVLALLVAASGALLYGARSAPGIPRALGAGLLLGAAALISPRVLVFAPLLALASRWWRPALWLALGIVVVLAPWTVRNYRCFGEFIPTTSNGGVNLYIAHNPNATGGYYLPPEDQRPDYEKTDNAAWAREALAYVGSHPGQTVSRAFKKAARFWNPHYGDQLIVVLLFVVGWVRLVRVRPPRSPELMWVLAAPFVMTAVHMVFFVQVRYMIPVLPFVCVVAGAAVGGWQRETTDSIASPE
jgi:hypothetical protein